MSLVYIYIYVSSVAGFLSRVHLYRTLLDKTSHRVPLNTVFLLFPLLDVDSSTDELQLTDLKKGDQDIPQ